MSSPQIIEIKELDLEMIQPATKTYTNPSQGGHKIVVIGKPGCFAVNTPVLMFDRTLKYVQDVKVGEKVMGPDSSSRTVLELCRNVEEMYEIQPEKGMKVTVNKNHILTLIHRSTHEIIDIPLPKYLKKIEKDKAFKWNYMWFFMNVDLPPEKRLKTSLFTVTPVEKDQYYGFTLDKDGRFLLGDYSVVHNTGKTTLISSILYAKKHIIPTGIVFSGTEDSNGFYRNIFPSTFVYNKYNEEQIKRFVSRQKLAKKYIPNPWSVLLLDDCTDEPALFRKPLQQSLYKAGRHWKMLYILSLQYCMDVRPVIRTNVDGCFILRETNLKNRKALYENYAGIIPDFSLFCSILDQITDDYTALYIHNATQVNNWEDCVYWYKAQPTPSNFKFGCPDFWEFHFQRYDPSYVDPLF